MVNKPFINKLVHINNRGRGNMKKLDKEAIGITIVSVIIAIVTAVMNFA